MKLFSGKQRHLVYRHRLPVRVMHWINFICLTVLLMSGLQIFNAHPALYWGHSSHFTDGGFFGTPFASIYAGRDADGNLSGTTRIGDAVYDTTGVLGASRAPDGTLQRRAFPYWATLPGPQWLAMGRHWHFFFAWALVINAALYVLYALFTGHLWHDLLPRRGQLRRIGRTLVDHLRLRFPKGDEALDYNVLQKLAYLAVIFILGPLIVLTGLTMSPAMDAAFPQLPWLFGGRQSARTIHFICAFSFLGFFAIHVAMVLISGAVNNLRSMITGWYGVDEEPEEARVVTVAPERRRFLALAAAGSGALLLAGCDRLSRTDSAQRLLQTAEGLTRHAQHLVGSPQDLAPTFSVADIDHVFRANGSTNPQDPHYQAMAANGFRNWRLLVTGRVARPLELSLADLRAMAPQTQITRHDCVEGWSCIGQWTGVPLEVLLDAAEPLPGAQYVVFHCADTLSGSTDRYYESLDLAEAYHPQTILAYALNGKTLPVAHGAPLRLRAERKLGYKMAKYVMRIEVVESLDRIGRGHGGYWEDRGYDWYAGI